jgi:hypothetical protein
MSGDEEGRSSSEMSVSGHVGEAECKAFLVGGCVLRASWAGHVIIPTQRCSIRLGRLVRTQRRNLFRSQ